MNIRYANLSLICIFGSADKEMSIGIVPIEWNIYLRKRSFYDRLVRLLANNLANNPRR